MKPLGATPELLRVARRVMWFEEPERALAGPIQFLARVMVFGAVEDLKALRNRQQKRPSRSAGVCPGRRFRRAAMGLLEFGLRPAPTPPFADTLIASDAPNATVNRRPSAAPLLWYEQH
jgi:hypothetical protein